MKKIVNLILFILFFTQICFAESPRLTLTQAIQLASAQNPALKAESLNVEKANLQVQTALATAIPNLKMDITKGQMDSYQSRALAAGLATNFQNSATANAITNMLLGKDTISDASTIKFSSSVVFGMYTLPVIQNAQVALDIAKSNYEAKRQSIAYQVAQAYYTTIKAQKYQQLLQETLTQVQGMLNQTKFQFQVGLIPKTAVLFWEVRLKETEAKLLESKKGLQLSLLNLNLLLGNPLDQVYSLDQTVEITNQLFQEKAYYLEFAYARPDFKSLLLTRQALSAIVSITEASGYPVLVLTGSYSYIGSNNFTFDKNMRDWMVAGVISWTLFDGFSTASKIDESKNNLAQMDEVISNVKKQIEFQVIEAMLSIDTAKATITTATSSLQLAKDNLDITQDKFKTGVGTTQDVLDAQLGYLQAQTMLLTAQFDQVLAMAKLNYAIGKN